MKQAILFILLCCPCAYAQVGDLPRTSPESQGIRSEVIASLFNSLLALPQTDIHSILILRHGQVVGEMYPKPFSAASMHTLYSCSKTFVGAAVGIAISENKLRLTDRVALLLSDKVPRTISQNLASITVRHLLTMTSGIRPDWDLRNRCDDWIRQYLSKEVSQPGTTFQYDSLCSYLLSAIIQKVTGQPLLQYLQEKLFTPMNITQVDWEVSPEGIHTGGWGLRMQSESLAKFGLLFLNQGKWQGKQLIPASWIEAMTTPQIADYGYQMWQCQYPGAVRADGAYGQYILIIPRQDMVVVITECSRLNGKDQRHLIWNHLLPQVSENALPEGQAYSKLRQAQKACSLPLVGGKNKHPSLRTLQQHPIQLPPNEYGWKQLRFMPEKRLLKLQITNTTGHTSVINLSHGAWTNNLIPDYPPYSIQARNRYQGLKGPFSVAGCYGWIKDELHVHLHYTSWISAVHLTIRPTAHQSIELQIQNNYSDHQTTISIPSSK